MSIIYIPALMILTIIDEKIIEQVIEDGMQPYYVSILTILAIANVFLIIMIIKFYKRYIKENGRK